MLCQKCNKAKAVASVYKNINGKASKMYLCEACSQQEDMMFKQQLSSFSFPLSGFFGGVWEEERQNLDRVCSCCKTPLQSILNTSYVGCQKCYDEFSDVLLPMIQKVHGVESHKGKVIPQARQIQSIEEQRSKILRELNIAQRQNRLQDAEMLIQQLKRLENR